MASELSLDLELLEGSRLSSAEFLAWIFGRAFAADAVLQAPLPPGLALSPRGRLCRILLADDAALESGLAGLRSIETGRLEVRRRATNAGPIPEMVLVTLEPEAEFPSLALLGAGSVSLARGGLAVVLRRPAILDRLRQMFHAAWSEALPLERVPVRPPARPARPAHELVAVREETIQVASGEVVYARCLSEYFAGRPAAAAGAELIDLTAFQIEAVERAASALERFGGVVVADSVGLGKTFVGLALIERYLKHGCRVLVVTPAALRKDWRRALAAVAPLLPESERRAWLDPAPIRSPLARVADDNLSLELGEPPAEYAPRLAWRSMESLGRGPLPAPLSQGLGLVVVDEAHQFRNPATRRYRTLAELARGARVALLTATPVNNTPRDLLHLLALFAGPGDFRSLGVPDLRAAFRDLAGSYDEAEPVLSAVVIRRTRPFVLRHYRGATCVEYGGRKVALRFPRRAPPQPVRYNLASTYGRLYDRLERELEALSFTALEPYTDAARRGAVAALVRILFLKRMESSAEALRRSTARQLAFHVEAERALREGRRLTRTTFQSLFEVGEEREGVQLALSLVLSRWDGHRPRRDYARAIARDLKTLRRLHAMLAGIPAAQDAKLKALERLLRDLRGEKVLIFTEFRDTARYLFRRLRALGGVAEIDSGRAILGAEGSEGARVPRRFVIERFAPRANGVREPPARERVDILIATDVLSEGLNLQDARHVVSYDLPWNPVRLIQRAGRIDRLGSPHDTVYVRHFMPEEGLERLLGLVGTLREKLSAIERTVGLEHPVLESQEIPDPAALANFLDRLAAGDASALDEIECAAAEPFEWEERLHLEFESWVERHRSAIEAASALGDGVVAAAAAVAAPQAGGSAFYFRAQAEGSPPRRLWLVADDTPESLRIDRSRAVELFTLARDLLPAPRPRPRFHEIRAAAWGLARRWVEGLAAQALASDRVDALTPQGRALRWLAAFARTLDDTRLAELGPKIDRLAAALARRQPKGVELALEQVVTALPHAPEEAALRTLDEFLEAHPEWRDFEEARPPAYQLREICAVDLGRRDPSELLHR